MELRFIVSNSIRCASPHAGSELTFGAWVILTSAPNGDIFWWSKDGFLSGANFRFVRRASLRKILIRISTFGRGGRLSEAWGPFLPAGNYAAAP